MSWVRRAASAASAERPLASASLCQSELSPQSLLAMDARLSPPRTVVTPDAEPCPKEVMAETFLLKSA